MAPAKAKRLNCCDTMKSKSNLNVTGKLVNLFRMEMLSKHDYNRSKYVKYIYSIPICAVWACETACFIVRNGPFCVLKRSVSERKMA